MWLYEPLPGIYLRPPVQPEPTEPGIGLNAIRLDPKHSAWVKNTTRISMVRLRMSINAAGELEESRMEGMEEPGKELLFGGLLKSLPSYSGIPCPFCGNKCAGCSLVIATNLEKWWVVNWHSVAWEHGSAGRPKQLTSGDLELIAQVIQDSDLDQICGL
jgi:hypothetical protein